MREKNTYILAAHKGGVKYLVRKEKRQRAKRKNHKL
jgi:hypothetical protein